MSKKKPTQTTPKGYEIPIPERGDVMDAFQRIAGPQRGRDQDRKATQRGGSKGRFKKQRGRAKP